MGGMDGGGDGGGNSMTARLSVGAHVEDAPYCAGCCGGIGGAPGGESTVSFHCTKGSTSDWKR